MEPKRSSPFALSLSYARRPGVAPLLLLVAYLAGCGRAGPPRQARTLDDVKKDREAVDSEARQLEQSAQSDADAWATSQQRLDRLLQENARVRSDLSGYVTRLSDAVADLLAGRTPPAVDAQVNNAGSYLQASQRCDDAAIELDALAKEGVGEKDPTVVTLKRRVAQMRDEVASVERHLRTKFDAVLVILLVNEIAVESAMSAGIDQEIDATSGELRGINARMSAARTREAALRDERARLDREIETTGKKTPQ